MHNVELKAELRDAPLARSIAVRLGATPAVSMRQTDTYYRIPSGRLKRREITNADGSQETEYIFYDRADRASPRLSHYIVYDEPTARERFGTRSLPTELVVTKQRDVFLTGPLRIHVDEVDRLGAFIEFEAVVSRAYSVRRCHQIVSETREAFLPAMGEPIAVSYSDLMRLELSSGSQTSAGPSSGMP
ncbi:MAG: class IV adenylate cyclase [Planctomycetota bacterium]